MNLKKIGDNIKKARKKGGLTQLQVAKKTGIHVNYFSRIERGEETPSMEVLEAISKSLKVNSADILPF
jgi:transcriptional regulator with XRE-family HTH domain